jgi:CRP-like cAMP-binding protein
MIFSMPKFSKFKERFDKATRLRIIESMDVRKFLQGEKVFTKGDPSDYFIIVLEGELSLYSTFAR